MKRLLLSALAVLAFGVMANASITFDFTADGRLTGVNNLLFNGDRFNVNFVDGSCAEVFGGCDSVTDFDFQNRTDAVAASDALFTQVFSSLIVFEGETVDFVADTTRVFGCDGTEFCAVAVPFGFAPQGGETFYDGVGVGIFPNLDPAIGLISIQGNRESGSQNSVFARFSSAVPEPATWLMMIIGFAGVGLMARRRSRVLEA